MTKEEIGTASSMCVIWKNSACSLELEYFLIELILNGKIEDDSQSIEIAQILFTDYNVQMWQ